MDTKSFFASIRQSNIFWLMGSLLWFIIGALAGPFVEYLNQISDFFKEKGTIFIIFWPFAFLLASLLIVVSKFAGQAENREKNWQETLKDMEKHIGIPAELIFEPLEKSTGSFYDRLASYIQEASPEDEILLMDYYSNIKGKIDNPTETDAHKRARENYLKVLEKKAAEPDMIYKRIICFDTGPEKGQIREGQVEKWKVDHCKNMLDIQKEKPDKIFISKSGTTFCSDMLIIGRKKAIISVDFHDFENGSIHTDGTLIFSNPPNAQIINTFIKMFDTAESSIISIKKIPE